MAVKFVKATIDEAEHVVAVSLTLALQKHHRVLWLISGGSIIPLAARVMANVLDPDSKKLAIMLTDERFGPVGFPDSNLKQLFDAGFQPKHATVVPVLRPGVALPETTELYRQAVSEAIAAADYVITLLGMGADGHIAGILPYSPATKPTDQMALSYIAKDYTRITLTPHALSRVSEALLVVMSYAKLQAIENLQKVLPMNEQPAQLLKTLPSLTILSDQIGGTS